MRWLLAFLLLASPAVAQDLAAIRPFVTVEEPMVRLSDLFEGAGPRASTVLGPAPAPGQRMVIEAPQLAAIARQQGIAWRPVAGAERVVLERPGRPIAREEVMAALRTALRQQGMEADAELELTSFAPPLVPLAALVQVAIEQASLEPQAGRFAATLAIAAEGMPTARMRVAGRVVATLPMLVAARRMQVGEVVREGDVRVIRVPAARLRPGVADRPEQVVGQALRRPAAAEQPLLVADIQQPVVVDRGGTVTMLYDMPGLTLTAQGRAMESGARGAVVPVMNTASRVVVEAQVIGPGRVRVTAVPR
jgi:flagella basal body P-ring formation protein FlgA